MNKAVIFIVLVLVVGSLFTLAQEQLPQQEQQEQEVSQGQEEQECGFWCKVGKLLSGEGREKVVGKGVQAPATFSYTINSASSSTTLVFNKEVLDDYDHHLVPSATVKYVNTNEGNLYFNGAGKLVAVTSTTGSSPSIVTEDKLNSAMKIATEYLYQEASKKEQEGSGYVKAGSTEAAALDSAFQQKSSDSRLTLVQLLTTTESTIPVGGFTTGSLPTGPATASTSTAGEPLKQFLVTYGSNGETKSISVVAPNAAAAMEQARGQDVLLTLVKLTANPVYEPTGLPPPPNTVVYNGVTYTFEYDRTSITKDGDTLIPLGYYKDASDMKLYVVDEYGTIGGTLPANFNQQQFTQAYLQGYSLPPAGVPIDTAALVASILPPQTITTTVSGQTHSYTLRPETGKIRNIDYTTKYVEGNTIIYVDANGKPIGYSLDGGTSKNSYGSKLGPQAKALEAIKKAPVQGTTVPDPFVAVPIQYKAPAQCTLANDCVEKIEGEFKTQYFIAADGNLYWSETQIDNAAVPISIKLPPNVKLEGIQEETTALVVKIISSTGERQAVIFATNNQQTIPTSLYTQLTAGKAEIKSINAQGVLEAGEGDNKRTLTKVGTGDTNTGYKISQNVQKPKKDKPTEQESEWVNEYFYPSGTHLYTQTESQQKRDKLPAQITAADGKTYSIIAGQFNYATGTCASSTPCLQAEDGTLKGRHVMGPGDNPFDKGIPALMEQECKGGECTQEWNYEIEEGSGDQKKSKKVKAEQKCKGQNKCDMVTSDEYTIDGIPRYSTDYGLDGPGSQNNDVREYETALVGVFNRVDEGVGTGKCQQGGKCQREVHFSDDNDYACPSSPCIGGCPDNQEGCTNTPGAVSTDQEGWESNDNLCGNDAECKNAATKTHNDKGVGLFFAGEQEWQKGIGAVLDSFSGWNSLSLALFGDTELAELANSIDRWFAGSVLSEDYWESSYCYSKKGDLQDDKEGYAFIDTPAGFPQPVATIQAEMVTEKTPLLCMLNTPEGAGGVQETKGEEKFVCPGELVCNEEDQFCYEEGAEQPSQGYFYKITWGVRAPADEKLTPGKDEKGNGQVAFNIYLDTIPLYDGTIVLKTGQSDGDKITHYSDINYAGKQVCIKWTEAPLTLRRNDASLTSGTKEVRNVCFTIVSAEQGRIEFTPESSTSSTSVQGGDVQRNNNW